MVVLLPAAEVQQLEETARRIRVECVHMAARAGGGHIGPALSCADIMAVLYFHTLKIGDLADPDRDRFILSAGHKCMSLYAALALKGYMPLEELKGFLQISGKLGGHPDMHRVPGVEASTGALGHGLGLGIGMAMACRRQGKSYRTFVLLGDGECDEGSVWEGALAAAHFGLDSLTCIVDRNGLQIDGPTESVMALEPLVRKWESFGWAALEVNGHDVSALAEVLDQVPFSAGRPSVVIARTIKGRGVSFMENSLAWHYGGIAPEQAAQALAELGERERAG